MDSQGRPILVVCLMQVQMKKKCIFVSFSSAVMHPSAGSGTIRLEQKSHVIHHHHPHSHRNIRYKIVQEKLHGKPKQI
jgi:hypothetical protein